MINKNKYYSGWFLPTWRELQRLVRGVDGNGVTLSNNGRSNLTIINNSITSIATVGANGTRLLPTSSIWIWSSSQGMNKQGYNNVPWLACKVNFQDGIGDSKDYTESKLTLYSVVIMRSLDD